MGRKTLAVAALAALLLIASLPWIASWSMGTWGIGKNLAAKAIGARIHGRAEVGSVSFSWLGPQRFFDIRFSNNDLKGAVEEFQTDAPFWSMLSQGASFQIKNGSVSVLKAAKLFGGTISGINGQIAEGRFDLTGTAQQDNSSGSLAVQGRIVSKTEFALSAHLQNIPTAAVDALLQAEGKLTALLGPSFTIAATASQDASQGTLDLDLSSPNTQAVLRGTLTNGALTLREPLTGTFLVTPYLGEDLLRGVNPLFLNGLASKSPATFRVFPEGFSAPLAPFSLDRLAIGHAAIDLGKVQCRIGKSFAALLSLFKGIRYANTREMEVWFTPLSFSLQKGILHAGRMDALLSAPGPSRPLHICTWGKIDLNRDRLHMVLGIPADTLRQSLGIEILSENFILKIPLTGSTKDPELDKGPAAAKLAAMAAGQWIQKKEGVFGGFLNKIIESKEDEGVPPPNRPFPWE